MTAQKRLGVLFSIVFVLVSIVFAGSTLITATQPVGAAAIGSRVATGFVLESDVTRLALVVIIAFLSVNSAARLSRAAKVVGEPAS